ncbi:ABC-2 family transporter protein [Clostridiales bacterium CHKCI001]|nr:ABC-2 family transporter protein [Clostridiales bacterium CHKCI001]
MKLVGFELKKLFFGRIKWILLFLALINWGIYYVSLIPSIPIEQMMEVREEWTKKIETQCKSLEEAIELLSEGQRDSGVTILTASVLYQMSSEYQAVLEYESFIGQMQERADQMTRVSIFSKKGSFSSRNIQKTVQDFKQMESIQLEPVDGTGIELFQNFYLTDILMILIIGLFCFQQFGRDNKSGMSDLIQSTPNGRGKLRFSQMCAIWMAVVGIGIFLYGSNLIITIMNFTFDFSVYIQGITIFRNVPFPLTIGMYCICYCMGKLIALFFITVVCQLLAIRWNGSNLAWTIFGALLCISFSLWFFLPESPTAKIFQYLNLVGILDIKKILGSYQNLNLFSYPVSLLHAAIVFVIAISLISIFAALKIKRSQLRIKIFRGIERKEHHVWKTVFYYEQYKIFWSQKLWIIILVLVGIGLYGWIPKIEFISQTEFYYNQYIAEVEGEYTEEKWEIVQNMSANSEMMNEGQRKAVEQIERQADSLKQQKNKKVAFVNENQIGSFFFDKQSEIKHTLIIVIAVLLSSCSLFYQDRKINMHHLLYTMPQNKRIFWNKIKIAAILGAGYTIIVWFFPCISYFLRYGIQNTDFLIQSLPEFAKMKLECSIFSYVILTMVIRILIGIYIGVVVALLAQLFLNPTQVLISGVILFVVPLCIGLIGNIAYQNALISFINEKLKFIRTAVNILTAFQCEWYRMGSIWMILFCAIPIAAVSVGYRIWIYNKR